MALIAEELRQKFAEQAPVLKLNTPDQIVTREEGARFYCVSCQKTYQKCKCRVYVSVDHCDRAKRGCTDP